MTTAYTSLLGLALPVTGELSGTWGDTVNDAITSLVDTAIAGTTSLTTDADVTLTTTTGAANEARQAILRWNPAAGTVTRNITAPATSKVYIVINASGGTQSIVLRGVGPTTGVTIVKDETAVCAWNGSDFIKIATRNGDGAFTTLSASSTVTFSGLTASQAVFTNASKQLVSNAITGTGNVVMSTGPTMTLPNATGLPLTTGVTGTLPIANGGTNATSAPAAMASLMGFTSTATAAGTTTLTNTSSYYQVFTGTTTQTVLLPVTSTLQTGWTFHICNNSTGNVSVQSSGANAVITVLPGTTAMCTCIGTTLTTAADWESGLTDFSTVTGTGNLVLAASPTLSGTPLAVTAAEKTSTTQIATCAFVDRLRSLTTPSTAASGAVTAVVGDRGALLAQTSGSVTIPNAVFAARDVLTIYNNSAADITITQGASFTLRFAGTATTGNRTLAQRGLATVVFISASEAVISGGGLS